MVTSLPKNLRHLHDDPPIGKEHLIPSNRLSRSSTERMKLLLEEFDLDKTNKNMSRTTSLMFCLLLSRYVIILLSYNLLFIQV